MKVHELIEVLELGIDQRIWSYDDNVYVDWDMEGGNEEEVKEVRKFDAVQGHGIKIV